VLTPQDLLGEVGGIEAVVDELRLHVASSSVCYTASAALSDKCPHWPIGPRVHAPQVCYTASAALHSALDGHAANSARFVECGGLALFEDIVSEHDDPKINVTVEKMMAALALDPLGRQRLLRSDGLIFSRL
jgi:hypothetical protein